MRGVYVCICPWSPRSGTPAPHGRDPIILLFLIPTPRIETYI